MRAKIRQIRQEAEGINSDILEAAEGGLMPAFAPGAHIDVQLKAGLARSYSLVNDPAVRGSYEIAVHLAPDSRGGSRFIHEEWRVGQEIEISEPKNNFPMVEDAAHTVLIAGGIGVTPMLPMIARLERLGRSWELHYVAASPDRAASVSSFVAGTGHPTKSHKNSTVRSSKSPISTRLHCTSSPSTVFSVDSSSL